MTAKHKKVWLDAALGLGLAALASWALGAYLPKADALRSTLRILPLLVWAFDQLSALATSAGGPRLARLPLLGVAGGFLLLALLRSHLGLASADAVLMATYFGLWLVAIVKLIPALRRRLGYELPLRPHLVFFLLPLFFYLAVLPWTQQERPPDGDEPYYLLLCHSLAHDFDIDLANNYAQEDWRAFLTRKLEPQPGDPQGPNGEIHSRHPALLPLLLVPLYLLFGPFGAALGMCLMTATLAWLFLRLAARYVPERPAGALLAWLLFAFGPPLLLYSAQIWIEVPAALLLALALDRVAALSRLGETRFRDVVVFGAVLALMPLLKIRLLLLVLPLLLLAALRGKLGGRRTVQLATGLGVVVLALFAYNLRSFGNPFKMYGRGDFELLASPPADYLRGLVGIFFDCAFGLFASAPAWWLLLPALLLVFLERRRFLGEMLLVAAPYTLAFAPRLEWYGGWAPPFRYPLVLLPIFGLLLVFALERRQPWGRVVWAGLGLATFLLTLIWLTQPGFTYNTADGLNHLLQRVGFRLDADLGRMLPSTVRPRLATWLWLGASLLLLPLFALWRGQKVGARRWLRLAFSGSLGVFLLFLGSASLLAAAEKMPTRRAEIEDGWVRKNGGSVEPDQWITQRPAFRGGWRLQPGNTAQIPLVAGSERVLLLIEAMNPNQEPEELEVRAGSLSLGSVTLLPGSTWQKLEIGPFDWTSGEVLVLVSAGQGAVVVDAVEISWL